MQHNKHKFIISGGGTGGHIFPAIAIANELKARFPEADILFVGARGRMEMEKVPQAGYPIKGLWISGLQRKLTIRNLLFPFKVIFSLIQAGKIIKAFKPEAVIGVGGYASGPLLRVAARKKIFTLIQEQNSYPGITNKLLSAKANVICVAYPGMERFFPAEKIILTGNPVRKNVVDIKNKKTEALKFFSLQADKKVLLVIGGSLGAKTINESIFNALNILQDQNIQLIWQTGKSFFDIAATACKSLNNKGIHCFSFINDMDLAYAAADAVISRAGAIAISELCLVQKPLILVPSPNVAEDHQTKNALALTSQNAAIMVKDSEAGKKLISEAVALLMNEELCSELSQNIIKFAHHDAATAIADIIAKNLKKNA